MLETLCQVVSDVVPCAAQSISYPRSLWPSGIMLSPKYTAQTPIPWSDTPRMSKSPAIIVNTEP